ncbi:MAG: YceI family protein [Sporichthyaceae bacterium]|nr:YceI family protein [Sporichthyaceae bacterium]
MTTASARRRPRRWRWAMIGVAVAALVAAIAGPYAHIQSTEDRTPGRLSAAADSASGTTRAEQPAGSPGSAAVDGTWKVTAGSQAGYRVKEVLFGQDTEAVGRTSSVTGQITVDGTRVTAGSFSVDLTSVKSDQARRDAQFQGRIMATGSYPAATFTPTTPVGLGSVPADGQDVTAQASGKLTLHGTTREVTVALTARRSGDAIRVSGEIPVTFADWGIPNPSFGPISTEAHGLIEFALVFAHA